MIRQVLSALALAALLDVAAGPAHANSSSLVSIQTPRGVKQAFILIRPKTDPAASVILLAGGHGALGLKSASAMKWGAGNFLVRSRERFADQGFMVAVVDAPADKQDGMNGVFRMGAAHAGDIGAVIAYLKQQAPVPVWLVGTSMGTFSAAGGAIASRGTDGLVLSSTMTRTKPDWVIAKSHPDSVASMDLPRVSVPTLIRSSIRILSERNFRTVIVGLFGETGGMITLTREPSGKRASTIGCDSSTRRPMGATMRSITR